MGWPLPDGAVLGLFARRPDPGLVKTRLAATLGSEAAAGAYEAMLLDIAEAWGSERVLDPGGRRVLIYTPADAGPWFDSRVAESWSLQPQVEGDLGARMRGFFEGEFADGASRVVLIGSDSPTLDPTFVVSAFLLLLQKDVVLGPATDGGYYLIGLKPPVPPIFEGIDWSSSRVLGQTVARLEASGHTVGMLPPWYDVDTPDDWETLTGHVRLMHLAGRRLQLPRLGRLLTPKP